MKIHTQRPLSFLATLLAFCSLNNIVSSMNFTKIKDSPRARRHATVHEQTAPLTLKFMHIMNQLEEQQSSGSLYGLELIEYEQEPSAKKQLKSSNNLDWETCSLKDIFELFTQVNINKKQSFALCLSRFINSLKRITSDNETEIVTRLSQLISQLSEIKSIDFSYNIEMFPDNIDTIAPIYLRAIWSNLRSHCTKLETIILDGNNIASLYEDERFSIIFGNINKIKTLKTLSLKNCNLTSCQNIRTGQEQKIRMNINNIFTYCNQIKELFLQGNSLSQLFNKNTNAINLSYLTNLKCIEKIYVDASMNFDNDKLDTVFRMANKRCFLKTIPLWGGGKEQEYNHNSTWLEITKS